MNHSTEFYLKIRHKFSFDGRNEYVNKKGASIIVYDKEGVDGITAFEAWDNEGKIRPTKHPNILHSLLKTKGSVNLHIKMYAEDRARGYLPKLEFLNICEQLSFPVWVYEAVEKQKFKYYDNP